MCPLYPVHLILTYVILLCPVWLATCVVARQVAALAVQYSYTSYTIRMGETKQVPFVLMKVDDENKTTDDSQYQLLHVYSMNPEVVQVDQTYILSTIDTYNSYNGSFNITGNWLGKTEIYMNVSKEDGETHRIDNSALPVTIIRKDRLIDHIFTISVATLVSVMYIHFGCALDWSYLKATIKRPIGPIIGFCGQFIIMPLLSFLLGRLLFPNDIPLQLGMFFTGVSPAGGASNIWTLILGGNINLSIAMTSISTLSAFGMMPLWIFTLGRVIFKSSANDLAVPYRQIATFALALVVPLGIGYLIQKYKPKLSHVMVTILKPFASCLLIFIIVFAIITNTYLFELFTWRMVVAGLGLPWLGYLLGSIAAFIFRQSVEDILAIGIETGIQNTGIAIFLLRISLPQPEADLTTVVPVAVAIMTPFPLMFLFLYRKLRGSRCEKKSQFIVTEDMKQSVTERSHLSQSNNGTNNNNTVSTISRYRSEDDVILAVN